MSILEEKLLAQIIEQGFPNPELEYRFHPVRKWRFDMYWPRPLHIWRPLAIACDIEGGTFSGGRHVRGKGYEGDCEKYNEAALMEIIVIRVTAKHIKDGSAVDWLGRALGGWRKDSNPDMRPLDGP